jgi:hypothetical protein
VRQFKKITLMTWTISVLVLILNLEVHENHKVGTVSVEFNTRDHTVRFSKIKQFVQRPEKSNCIIVKKVFSVITLKNCEMKKFEVLFHCHRTQISH